jgi:hypothetical protein
VSFAHYPPINELGAERLRATTVAWSTLLGELHAVGLRPYLELAKGAHDDPLRLYCELDDELLVDLSINDGGIPDTPPPVIDGEWTVFVQDASDLYLAEVVIEPSATFTTLATKLRDLLDSVALGERPLFEVW